MADNILRFETIDKVIIRKIQSFLDLIIANSPNVQKAYADLMLSISRNKDSLPNYFRDLYNIIEYIFSNSTNIEQANSEQQKIAISQANDLCNLFLSKPTVDDFKEWVEKDLYSLDVYTIFDEQILLQAINDLSQNATNINNIEGDDKTAQTTYNRNLEFIKILNLWTTIISMDSATGKVYSEAIKKVNLTSTRLEGFFLTLIDFIYFNDKNISFEQKEHLYLEIIKKLKTTKIYKNSYNLNLAAIQNIYLNIILCCIESKKLFYEVIDTIYPMPTKYYNIFMLFIEQFSDDEEIMKRIIKRLNKDMTDNYYDEPTIRKLLIIAMNVPISLKSNITS